MYRCADKMGDMRWRLVGDVDDLRQAPCRRLSSSTTHSDLVLIYVAKLDKFFALDGLCSHLGKSISVEVVVDVFLLRDALHATTLLCS